MNYTDSASRIWLSDCSKLAINWKNINDVTIFRHDVIVKFFWHCFTSLVKFSYWYEFHVNFITGSGVMTISFNMRLTRNLEIPPSEFCLISGDWDEVGIPNLARAFLIRCYWMLQNASVTAFTVSELLKENQQEGGGGGLHIHPLPTEIRVNNYSKKLFLSNHQNYFNFLSSENSLKCNKMVNREYGPDN